LDINIDDELGGGGVDGRIHTVCGDELMDECASKPFHLFSFSFLAYDISFYTVSNLTILELDGCNTGDAKITKAYGKIIGCKHIIHTVGPVYSSYSEATATKLLKSCYTRSLQVAVENGVKSVAFSCISTGVYGFPADPAARAACQTVRDFLTGEDGGKLDTVVFCTYLDRDLQVYERAIP